MTPEPRRLLVVSATIGEGHNATARAIEERARRRWPGCEIRRVDSLEVMGRWVGPAFRWIYRVNVDTTPWLYDFFYRQLWRRRWFATASCRFVAAWCGPRLAAVVEAYRPDLVVSTYPLGTGGLDWIRCRGRLDVPVAAFVSDIAPHPFWVYPEVDLHYVVSEASLQALYRARADARGAIGAPPVITDFHPQDKTAARRRCGLPDAGLVVLISCGAFGFGSVERAALAALRADPDGLVVVACGRNEALRARLAARGEPEHRLLALGWTAQMPDLTAAADVVVTNAGGATALEAIACGRAVLMVEPIAGHGKANARLLAQAGLATLCPGPTELVTALRELPTRLDEIERRALAHIASLDLDAEIAALPYLPRHHGAHPLAAADAFFVHAATPAVPQQVGAVLVLACHPGAGPPEQLTEHLLRLVADRVPGLPMLCRRLELRPGRRPRWVSVAGAEPADHVRARTVGAAHGTSWTAAVEDFFTTPVPLDRPPWQLEVLHDADSEQTAVLAKLHHALGDGIAVTATLVGLLSDREDAAGSRPSRRRATPGVRPARPGRMLRGLVSLAGAGFAPAASRRAPSGPARRFALADLPAAKVRAAARAHGTSTTALLLAVVGEALHRHGGLVADGGDRVRVLVPMTTRAVRIAGESGNHTAAAALDLPTGPMPPAQRVAEVAAELERLERVGQPAAAAAVITMMGLLPAPLHRLLTRLIYRRWFLTLIVSVLPGPRRVHHVLGARVCSVFPVLPLAPGVGLAVGMLSWADMLGVGVSADPDLFADADGFTDALRRGFDDLAAGVPAGPAGTDRGV
ncbi:MAG: wax ester/triacylglycerol synthase domain-containing protein [Pseudonocardia sp.]